ncbi:MAG: PEGA domain-containing protein [Tepidisphaeraceae bacterium]|jgi:hypothetical protein
MRAGYWTAIFCAAFLTGCASADKSITSDPPGAAVTINDDLIGTTPATYNFDFNRRTRYDVTVSKDGYISGSTAVYSDTAQANEQELHFGLEKDPSWDDTYECPAARNSLTIQVLPQFDQQAAWQRLVDAVTSRHSDIAKMDAASGYLATAPITRSYKSGEVTIRTTFYANIIADKTISLRFKIESERCEANGTFVPWHRVFKEDVQLVEELQDRLGVK